MPLDPSFAGQTFPPAEPYEVGREKIREFALAVGDLNPLYLDASAARAAGYPDVIAPPTFATILFILATDSIIHDPALGLDYSRVVHGDQGFSYRRPIHAGDHLQAVVRIDSIRSLGGNQVLGMSADFATLDGEHVFTVSSTLVERGAPS
jgi:acyl dehydratase